MAWKHNLDLYNVPCLFAHSSQNSGVGSASSISPTVGRKRKGSNVFDSMIANQASAAAAAASSGVSGLFDQTNDASALPGGGEGREGRGGAPILSMYNIPKIMADTQVLKKATSARGWR